MKERPILMSAPMVLALLDGRKTETRRLIEPQPIEQESGRWSFIASSTVRMDVDKFSYAWLDPDGHDYSERGIETCQLFKCPYGLTGDILWVRETWRPIPVPCGCFEKPCDCYQFNIRYAADETLRYFSEPPCQSDWEWPQSAKRGNVPSIFMPRWASRITLEICSIRVERLQAITEDGAIAEGMTFTDYGLDQYGQQHRGWCWKPTTAHTQCLPSAYWAYANLWEHLNGVGAWSRDKEKWVWVIGFKRCN